MQKSRDKKKTQSKPVDIGSLGVTGCFYFKKSLH